MFLETFSLGFRKSMAAWFDPPLPATGGVDEMKNVLQRERSRADRSDGEFSLVAFSANHARPPRAGLAPLAETVQRRLRLIDHLGWLPDGELGWVLMHCPAEAATKLAEKVLNETDSENPGIAYKVYHYSARGGGSENDGPSDNQFPQDNDERQARQERGPSTPLLENLDVNEPGSPQEMEPLLAVATPLWKRAMDVSLSAVGLTLLSPVLAAAALAIKLGSRGPVFFTQIRSGRSSKPFKIFKFRTMVVDAEQQKQSLLALNEQDGPAFKIERDPRVTTVGNVLRSLSIDELPQLWNVLRGDMSLVGPRPLLVDESLRCAPWHRARTDVVPGLTCSWQVTDRRTRMLFADWVRMDIRYIRSRSFLLDARLIVQTILFVLGRRGT